MGPPMTMTTGNHPHPGGPRRWMANLDLYKKVPTDLMEGTVQGSLFSYLVLGVIFVLMFFETSNYLTVQVVEELALDTPQLHRKKTLWGSDKYLDTTSKNKTPKLQVKFNVTMMDLKCEFATIDVISVLGAQQNVTKNIQKWMVSPEGVQERYDKNRNLQQHDIDMGAVELHDSSVTKTLEELHANGEDAIPLDEASLEVALKDNPFVFVDYFANWCSHCRLFAPTWERLAELMVDAKWHHHERVVQKIEIAKEEARKVKQEQEAADAEGVNLNVMENITYSEEEYQKALQAVSVKSPILVGKVDCVNNHQLCRKQSIMSYPTIRLYVNGEIYQDFFGSRTVVNLLQFVVLAEQKILGLPEQGSEELTFSDHAEVALNAMNVTDEDKLRALTVEKARSETWQPSEHPGCQIAGTLYLNKVPGNFYIQAQSPTHSLEPTLTNVSHEIHYLYFQQQPPPGVKPPTPLHELDESQRAQDGTIMVPPPKTSPVSSLSHPMNGNAYVVHEFHQAHHHYIKLVSTNLYSYQVVQNSQLVHYKIDQVPEAKFILDLSPIAVTYHASKRHWYDYITSIMAIVGGTFTVVGMLDGILRTSANVAKKVVSRRRPLPRPNTAAKQQNRDLPRPPPQPTREAFQHAHAHHHHGGGGGDPAAQPVLTHRAPVAVNTSYGAPADASGAAAPRKARTPLPRPPGR